jgi:hypothetical protein
MTQLAAWDGPEPTVHWDPRDDDPGQHRPADTQMKK